MARHLGVAGDAMNVPLRPAEPALPAAPVGTPRELIWAVSALLPAVGVILALVDPGGGLNAGAVKAAVIGVFLFAGLVIFTVHTYLAAVHEYGWRRQALEQAGGAEVAEIRRLIPEFAPLWSEAKPFLAQLPAYGDLAATVGTMQTRLAATPPADTAAIEAIVRRVLAGLAPAPAPTV